MKITNIDLLSSDGTPTANFSFRDPGSTSPYIIKEIIGLDADEIVPKFYGLSQSSSSKYYSLSLEEREIVLSIALNPQFSTGGSYSALRDTLYRGIAASRTGKVRLWFNNGLNVIAELYGFVTKFESVHFSKSPEVKITIRCEDPILKSVNPVSLDTSAFGILPIIVDSLSTAPHGFEFAITFTENSSSFVIHDHVTPEWSLTITYDFLAGDKLYFSSRHDEKFLYLERNAATILLVDKILINSVWPIIFPGTNNFHIESGTFSWIYLIHYLSYWGV